MTRPEQNPTDSPETTVRSRRRRGLGIVYPMRVLGATLPIVTTILYARAYESLGPLHYTLIALCLIHPHLFFFLGRRYDHARAQIDTWALLVDALYLGTASYIVGFSTMPTFVMAGVALANGLGIRGFRQMLLSALALGIGMALPTLLLGAHFEPQRSLAINLVCGVFFFVYFHLFAWAAYSRASLLKWTRRELREQMRTVDIEKRRTDLLMHNIGPASLVEALQRDGSFEPREYDSVTLIAVELCGVSVAARQSEPQELVGNLLHGFQAVDAICSRHGFEQLKATGTRFIAVGGLRHPGEPDPSAALDAAIEIRGFFTGAAAPGTTSDAAPFAARLAVHRGRVVVGLLETPKLSLDLWGEDVEILQRMVQRGPVGQITTSEAVQRLGLEGFDFDPTGSIDGQDGERTELFRVDRTDT